MSDGYVSLSFLLQSQTQMENRRIYYIGMEIKKIAQFMSIEVQGTSLLLKERLPCCCSKLDQDSRLLYCEQ